MTVSNGLNVNSIGLFWFHLIKCTTLVRLISLVNSIGTSLSIQATVPFPPSPFSFPACFLQRIWAMKVIENLIYLFLVSFKSLSSLLIMITIQLVVQNTFKTVSIRMLFIQCKSHFTKMNKIQWSVQICGKRIHVDNFIVTISYKN